LGKILSTYRQLLQATAICLFLLLGVTDGLSQTFLKGRVTDQETGEGITFVNVYLKGTTSGATTNLDGYYSFSTSQRADSLIASFVGYISDAIRISTAQTQTINFQLVKEIEYLSEVVFEAPENPAFAIMRNVVKNKKDNDRRSLTGYETENYTKIEFDIAQISEKFKQKGLVKKVEEAIDTIDVFIGEDGEPLFPIFLSESISKQYTQNRPLLQREEILKANISGVGIKNKKNVAQLTGVSFQQYNFYQNWMSIIDKDFISPIADGWKTFYDYYLIDSAYIDGLFCYRLDFEPKVEGDLAFKGTMWITQEGSALKQIDAVVEEGANLNFIKNIRLYQELSPTEESAWLPTKTKFEINISELTPNLTGVRAKFLISTRSWKLNTKYPASFFILPIEVTEDVAEKAPPEFWDSVRPEPLDTSEINALRAISAIRRIKQITMIAETIKAVRRGYIRSGPIDWGPWIFIYANNDVEGNRFRLGLRTNDVWSEKWVLQGFGAYGTRDNEFKYGGNVTYILNRKPYTLIGYDMRRDVEQLGVVDEVIRKGFIVSIASRFGTLRNPHWLTHHKIFFQTDLAPGLTQKVELQTVHFDPLFPFAFHDGDPTDNTNLKDQYRTTEVTVETRLTRRQKFIFDNNFRLPIGLSRAPVLIFKYTYGIPDLLGSTFSYHKVSARIHQRIPVGLLGTSSYTVEAGYIPSTIPYPTLKNHIGNSTAFFHHDAFNTMDFGEFVSDRWVFLKYNHSFQGFILNRIPLMRKLKWRMVAAFNVLYGGLRQENRDLIPPHRPQW